MKLSDMLFLKLVSNSFARWCNRTFLPVLSCRGRATLLTGLYSSSLTAQRSSCKFLSGLLPSLQILFASSHGIAWISCVGPHWKGYWPMSRSDNCQNEHAYVVYMLEELHNLGVGIEERDITQTQVQCFCSQLSVTYLLYILSMTQVMQIVSRAGRLEQHDISKTSSVNLLTLWLQQSSQRRMSGCTSRSEGSCCSGPV